MSLPSIQRTVLLAVVLAAASGCATLMSTLESLDAAPDATPADGLREALRVGTGRAVDALARTDGYLGDDRVRISVPDKLETLSEALRAVGGDAVVDRFVTSMNRAAEAAAPLARGVFLDAVGRISFEDALTILRGHDHEATDYLRRQAGPELERLFLPIVGRQLDSVGATRRFEELVERAERLPFVRRPVFDLSDYVTGRALDGLFETLGREERRIREDPVARTTDLLRRFFGEQAKS